MFILSMLNSCDAYPIHAMLIISMLYSRLSSPWPSVVAQGMVAVRSFLRERARQDFIAEAPRRQMSVMLHGVTLSVGATHASNVQLAGPQVYVEVTCDNQVNCTLYYVSMISETV